MAGANFLIAVFGRGFQATFLRCLLIFLAASSFLHSYHWGSLWYLRNVLLAVCAAFAISFAWAVIVFPKYVSPLRHLPGPSGGSFIHGQLWRILSEWPGMPMREWINTIPNQGIIRTTTVFNQERLILTSPEALREALVTKNYDWDKPKEMRKGLGRILGFGVLLASGADHKIQRKHLAPAFSFRQIKDTYPIFWNESCALVKIISAQLESKQSSGPIPWLRWANKATLDIIGLAIMGRSFGAMRDPESELNAAFSRVFATEEEAHIVAALETLENLFPVAVLGRLPLERNTQIKASAETIKKASRRLIMDKEALKRATDNPERQDILDAAMESNFFSRENLVDQIMTMLAAGHETTATSLGWALSVLCEHPEMQTRLRDEVRTTMPCPNDTSSSSVAVEALDNMSYLHAFCNEVLRVYPPVPLTRRTSCRDTTLLGHFVPKNSNILLVPAAVNMSRELWGADALDFKPERWLEPGKANSGGAVSNFANMTFLHGPRSCLGQSFARAELAFLLCAIIGRFEVSRVDESDRLDILPGFMWKIKGDLELQTRIVPGW